MKLGSDSIANHDHTTHQAWKKCRSRDLGSDKTADFGIKFELKKEEKR